MATNNNKRRPSNTLQTTPSSIRPKRSHLAEEAMEPQQQAIAALVAKLPEDPAVKELQESFQHLGNVLQQLMAVESAEEKERKRSLVVIGLPESNSGDSIERADADGNAVVSMLRALNIESRPDKHYRMGRPDVERKGPRLLKVVMPSSFLQRRTLGALKHHREQLRVVPGFSKAQVRPSLSPQQLAEDRCLRDELKKKWAAAQPGIKYWIKNGEIHEGSF
jgi:hypothetical protein